MRFARPLVPVLLASITVLAACGDDRTDSLDATTTSTTVGLPTTTAAPTTTEASAPATTSNPDKPAVSLPSTLPTELVVTDITKGTGPEAKAGDILVMNYVGVRSEDGTEFDNSYDRGQTFNLTLGAGNVIQGWDQGLVGIQKGGRRQLDIPADLAYGDNPPSDPIKAGDALSFVVDAVDVISAPDPSERPDITVQGASNVDTVQTTDLVAGTGAALTGTETAVVYLIAYRADTGAELLSSWDSGVLEELPLAQLATSLPGLAQGLTGMQVGGRRQITVPFALAFGADGNPDLGAGLPANTDLVVVVDLFGTY